jgi:hypothetical protein
MRCFRLWNTLCITSSSHHTIMSNLTCFITSLRIQLWPNFNFTSEQFRSMTSHRNTDFDLSCSNLVKCFVTTELMRWPGIESIYGAFLRKTPVFKAEQRWEDLHTRVVEHVRRIRALIIFELQTDAIYRTFVSLLNTIRESP